MPGRLCFIVVLTLFVILPCSANAQNGVQLRYDFPKDEPVIYRVTTEMNQTMQFGGQTYENKVTQTEVNTLALLEIQGVEVETLQAGTPKTNEIQRVTIISPNASSGTFTLTFDGENSSRIAYNATAATVKTELEALSNIAAGDVVVTGGAGGPWTVEFHQAYVGINVPLLLVDGSSSKETYLKLKHVNKQLNIKADMGPAGNYSFDSNSAEREKGTALSNQLNPVFETLSGVEYGITITPQGKVKELEGYKEIIETLVKDNPLTAQFTGGGSEQAQKDSLAEVFFVLKDKPVALGDSWEVPFELDLPKIGKAEGKRVYKFEGPITEDKPNIVRISVNTEVSFDFDLDSEGAKITGNIGTDSSKGDVRFDVEKGQVIQSNLEYTLSGNLNIQAGERNLKSTIKQTQKRSTQRLSELPK